MALASLPRGGGAVADIVWMEVHRYITLQPQQEYALRVSIIGAHASLRTDRGSQQVGFARPESPIEIRQSPNPDRMTPTLVLPLQVRFFLRGFWQPKVKQPRARAGVSFR
jgi:hypothetical protein